jgi:glycosyltransferase involved in cell wall biosynthesis
MGVLSDFKVDFRLIFDVALARPDWNWVIIGTEREGQKSEWVPRLKTVPNIHFLGHKAYEDLPAYLRGMQVGILPTLCNDYTKSMFPMKFYECIAAGLPIVSTPLNFLRSVSSNAVQTAVNAAGFAESIQRNLSFGRIRKEEVVSIIGDNTWGDRTKKMIAFLSLSQPDQ